MIVSREFKSILMLTMFVCGGCGLLDDNATKKSSNSGLIATPVTYYSTSRARYLGGKYKENLDRIVERIVRNPKTANLQFANNIASVGGIGFFTHSATKTADERYLEIVLAAPETFETKGAHSDKFSRLFGLYGIDLLGTLSSDNDIYQDKELTGYALNLSWRNVMADSTGNRVALERAIVYLSKEKSRRFLRREINQNELLADATIFAVEEDGPLNLISYRAPEPRQEFPATIHEDDISPAQVAVKPEKSPPVARFEPLEQVKKEVLPPKEPVTKVAAPKPALVVTQKAKPSLPTTPASEISTKPASQTPALGASTAQSVETAKPVELANLEVSAAKVYVPANMEVAPDNKPIAKNTESARAMLETPKPAITSNAPRSSPIDATSPVFAVPARAQNEAPPETLATAIESSRPAQHLDATKQPLGESKPFSPAVATILEPEPRKDEKSAQLHSTAKAPVNVSDIPGVSVRAMPEPPRPVEKTPAEQVLPIVTIAPLAIETPVSPVVATPPTPVANAEVTPREIASAPPAVVRSPSVESPVGSPASVSGQTGSSKKPPAIDGPAHSVAQTTSLEKTPAKPAAEQLASLAIKPIETVPTAKSLVTRSVTPKPLEGFIIQLAFNDKERAQRWAEGMEKKGFAISLTEAGNDGALRVRLGNFVVRDDAERQLKAIKQEGLSGIILNLPQAFRPETRTSIP